MPIAKTALVDESLRVGDGLYVLAAVIVADYAECHRQALRALMYRAAAAALARRERPAPRRDHQVGPPTPAHWSGRHRRRDWPNRQERARRKCIERLLAELTSRGIATIVFGRRHEELDALDRTLIAALRRQRSLSATFRPSWQAAISEPLLWLADIAAGAAALAATGDTTYWDSLAAEFSAERFLLT